MTAFRRIDISFASGDSYCAAWLYLPETRAPWPAVVLGHGLGATRDMRLDAYAGRFAARGMAALAFTYRNFGDSGGSARQLVSVSSQLTDWDAAIDFVRSRPDIDARRIALWGTSFGGGHVITVAARRPELAAAVAQCPFTDGLATLRTVRPLSALRLIPYVLGDLLARALRRPAVCIPLATLPGRAGMLASADALPGMNALTGPDTEFVNRSPARVVPRLLAYRPGRSAQDVQIPILFCVSEADTVAPTGPTISHVTKAPLGRLVIDPAGHFEFYIGEAFDHLVELQADFLAEHLLPSPG